MVHGGSTRTWRRQRLAVSHKLISFLRTVLDEPAPVLVKPPHKCDHCAPGTFADAAQSAALLAVQ